MKWLTRSAYTPLEERKLDSKKYTFVIIFERSYFGTAFSDGSA